MIQTGQKENVGRNLSTKSILAHRIKLQANKIAFYSIKYILLLIMVIPIFTVQNITRNLAATSKITIKIDEKGIQEIFSVNYTGGYPDRVFLNGQPTTLIQNRKIDLAGTNNIIRLEWDYAIANASTMFLSLSNITEVDLSEMNTDLLTNMSRMFAGCKRITSINLNNFKTPKVVNMVSLFSNCKSLLSLDVTSFDTSQVEYMHYLFHNCALLTSIDVSNFDTSNTKDMSSMFNGCSSLLSLDISNFNTTLVRTTGHMFVYCNNLISLNLSNFKTPSLEYWDNMFRNCSNLAYINLINAEEKNDLQSIDKILDYTIDNMVFCIKSSKIPKIFKEMEKKICKVYSCIEDWRSVQKKINPETNACIQSCQETTNYKYEYNSKCYSTCPPGTFPHKNFICYNYEEIEPTTQLILEPTTENQIITTIPKIETSINIVETTNEKSIITTIPKKETTINIIEPTTEKAIITTIPKKETTINIIEPSTEKAIITTIPKKETTINIIEPTTEKEIITTIPKKETTINIIEPTTEKEIITTTNKKETTINIIVPTTEKEIITTMNKIETTINNSKPSTERHVTTTMPIIETISVNDNDSKNTNILTNLKYTQIITDENINNNKETQRSKEISDKVISSNSPISNCNYDKYINNLCIINEEYNFMKEILQSYPYIKGKPVITTDGNTTIQITTGENEMACLKEGICDISSDMAIIDFSKCEILLRRKYNINKNISLIYVKTQSITNIAYEKNIQYEIYEPINKTKLDLSICQNITADIYIPINLSEETQRKYDNLKKYGYDLFNINDPFYLKICTPYKTENGTDVLLEDRKNDYYYSSVNETTCQSNCHFSKYLSDSKLLKCECSISNETIDSKDYKKFEPKKFYNTFYDILKYSNYKVLRCYNLAFHIDSVTINYGSIIIIALFFFYFIAFIRYAKNGIEPLKIDMMKRIFEKPIKDKVMQINYEKPKINNSNLISNRISFLSINKESQSTNKFKRQSTINPLKNEFKANNVKNNKNKLNPPKKRKSSAINNKVLNPKVNNLKISKTNKMNNKPKTIIIKQMNFIQSNNGVHSKLNLKQKNFQGSSEEFEFKPNNEKEKNKYDNYELNNMEYEDALQFDKRSMIKSYWSIINREHLILLTFCSPNDFNISFVKFARFIFLISTEITLNAYLFYDETMHKVYLSYGKYDFVQHIAQIIMTTVFSQLMEVFICYLSLSDSSIYQIKELARNTKQKQENLSQVFDILNCINKKIKYFFVFTFLLMAFYWYSVACFCAVYRNSQIIFLKDCGLSFLMELIEPFILYLFPSIFRAISLKGNGLSCLYKLSDLIPIF